MIAAMIVFVLANVLYIIGLATGKEGILLEAICAFLAAIFMAIGAK